jgi:hypothetical protein
MKAVKPYWHKAAARRKVKLKLCESTKVNHSQFSFTNILLNVLKSRVP